jgi:hypothetical protein
MQPLTSGYASRLNPKNKKRAGIKSRRASRIKFCRSKNSKITASALIARAVTDQPILGNAPHALPLLIFCCFAAFLFLLPQLLSKAIHYIFLSAASYLLFETVKLFNNAFL